MSDPTAPPPASPRVYAAVFAAAAIFIWLMLINDDWTDQYTLFFFGRRIAAGQIPYRDFFMHYPPVPGYAVGAWFKLFGEGAQGTRILLALCGAAATTLAFDIARQTIMSPLFWLGPIGALSSFIVGNEGIGHMTFSLPAGFAAIALGVRAERSNQIALWFLAGICAAVAALSTQTVGACLGLAMFLAALTSAQPWRSRFKCAAALCLGTAVVAIPAIVLLVLSGAWEQFRYDIFVWSLDRYLPFTGEAVWGSWLPPWRLLHSVPTQWWPVSIPAISMAWGTVWVLPFIPFCSLTRSILTSKLNGNRTLIFCCAALFISSFPHASAMRLMRLTGPVWGLVALELHVLVAYFHSKEAVRLSSRRAGFVAISISLFLLLATGLQQSYRNSLVALETQNGRILVHSDTKGEFEMLARHYRPGTSVLTLPDGEGAVFYSQFINPVRNDYALIPVLFSPEQLDQAIDDMTRQNFPPVILLPHPSNDIQWLMDTFKPVKYLEEFQRNPWNDFINKNYTLEFRDGPAMGFVKKKQ